MTKKIKEWCWDNIDPILYDHVRGEIDKKVCIERLTKLLDQEDIPRHRGYFSPPATDIVRSIMRSVSKGSPSWLESVREYLREERGKAV